MSFAAPDVLSDEGALTQAILAAIADQIANWQPRDGSLTVAEAEAFAIALSTAVGELQDTFQDAYMGFGSLIVNLTRDPATTATCTSTWQVSPNALTVIAAGTEVDGTLLDGTTDTFIVDHDIPVPPGAAVVAGVELVAQATGPEQNGFTNPANSDVVGVISISIDSPADAGQDAEDPAAYVQRVADRAKRLKAIPITPEDWSVFMTDVAGVARCVALNRFNPSSPGADSPGDMTLVGVDDNGASLSSVVKAAVDAYFATFDLPWNLDWFLADPDDVPIAVVVQLEAAPGTDPTVDVQSAVSTAFDPATFDADPTQPGGWAANRRTEITIFDVAAAIDGLNDPNIVSIRSITLNNATAPVALPAPVSLPDVTSVTVTLVS